MCYPALTARSPCTFLLDVEMPPLDRYTCEQVFRRMDDYLDRELTPAEVTHVREHLETCGACASEYGFEEAVLSNLKAKLRRVAVPSKLRERVERQLAAARAAPGGKN